MFALKVTLTVNLMSFKIICGHLLVIPKFPAKLEDISLRPGEWSSY